PAQRGPAARTPGPPTPRPGAPTGDLGAVKRPRAGEPGVERGPRAAWAGRTRPRLANPQIRTATAQAALGGPLAGGPVGMPSAPKRPRAGWTRTVQDSLVDAGTSRIRRRGPPASPAPSRLGLIEQRPQVYPTRNLF